MSATATTTSTTTTTGQTDTISGRWRLDPTRSDVEFHVRHVYGAITVKGHFERFEGTLDLKDPDGNNLSLAELTA